MVVKEGIKAGAELDGWVMEDDFSHCRGRRTGRHSRSATRSRSAISPKGDTIIKYGHDIGKAVAAIAKGGPRPRTHNVKTKRW